MLSWVTVIVEKLQRIIIGWQWLLNRSHQFSPKSYKYFPILFGLHNPLECLNQIQDFSNSVLPDTLHLLVLSHFIKKLQQK